MAPTGYYHGEFDLNKVDYTWVENTKNVTQLKRAYDELEQDGCFPELWKACGEAIQKVEPGFMRRDLGEYAKAFVFITIKPKDKIDPEDLTKSTKAA